MFSCAFVFHIQARTTYIPTYENRLIMIEDGELDSLSNKSHALIMSSKDNVITCTLAQQVVSENLVREIKKAKSAAVWAAVAAGFSSANKGMARSQMTYGYDKGLAMEQYIDARENTYASLAASENAQTRAEGLKTLLLDIVIRNNSPKEMQITDMDRGLVWYILPYSEVRLPLLKDEECHFRVSSSHPLDENVKYINAIGSNALKKYTVGMETNYSWYIPVSKKTMKDFNFETDQRKGYIKIDKESMSMNYVSVEELRELKKRIK